MKSRQHHFLNSEWKASAAEVNPEKCQMVLAFGSSALLSLPEHLDYLQKSYPNADIVFSSPAGEIINGEVFDDSIVATAVAFEKTQIKSIETNISNHENSYEAGLHLYNELQGEELTGIFIISDGTIVNGDELVEGLRNNNINQIPITGGLAGDGVQFKKTVTGLNKLPSQGNIIAIGFYGKDLIIGHGSKGGWEEFGLERTITHSKQNIVQEIDSQSALDLYKKYLGDYANELPGSALLFPLSMKVKDTDKILIRTILAVDDEQKSMIFAGNVPEGNKVKLMRANFDNLIDASSIAAKESISGANQQLPDLTIMISCVGRKIILDTRVWEEVKNPESILGNNKISGFYSYGGISPLTKGTSCELHNQTMTMTTFTEL